MISYFNKFVFLTLSFFICTFFSNKVMADGHANFEWSPEKPYYVIENPNAEGSEKQAINKESYYGYRIFHQNCHVCHGKAARGSSFAPNLLDSYKYAKEGKKRCYTSSQLSNTRNFSWNCRYSSRFIGISC